MINIAICDDEKYISDKVKKLALDFFHRKNVKIKISKVVPSPFNNVSVTSQNIKFLLSFLRIYKAESFLPALLVYIFKVFVYIILMEQQLPVHCCSKQLYSSLHS